MKTFKRVLTAFVFYPILVFWFIPRQWFRAHKYAEYEMIYTDKSDEFGNQIVEKRKRSKMERKTTAKFMFNLELQVAMASRRRLSSKKERVAVYQEHIKSITTSEEDNLFKELGIKDK